MQGSESPLPNQDQVTASNTAKSPELQTQYEQASILGRAILTTTQDREARRLTSFTQTEKFPKEDTSTTRKKPEGDLISEEDVTAAKRGSLALALEAAVQVNEFRPNVNAGIREDSDSLSRLIQIIKQGGTLNYDLIKQNPSLVAAEMKKAISRRQKISPNQTELTDEQLTNLADQQFRNAFARLNKSAQALSGYLGR